MILAFLLLAAVGQAPAPAAAPTTIQARFDQASAEFDAGRCSAAAAGFAALARLLPPDSSGGPLVQLRQGAALVCLGQDKEGAALLRSGLDRFGNDDPNGERALALLSLASAAETQIDFAAAARDYRAALALIPESKTVLRISALGSIARVTMFEEEGGALALVDQALALAASMPAAAKKQGDVAAQLHTLRGRILLNRGDYPGGSRELARAMAMLGGLTVKVDAADITARGDLAIAAYLNHNEAAAHQYLAATGAGRLAVALPSVADKLLPPCGLDGIRPDDVAVVQFGIRPDGTVTGVQPIYASRLGTVASTFARAVADWSWTAEDVAKMNPFFRAHTRLELRCTNAVERPDLSILLREDVDGWLLSRKIQPFDLPGGSAAQAASLQKAELARREAAAGKDDAVLLPLLIQVAANPAIPADERRAAAARAEGIVRTARAPAAVRASIVMAMVNLAWQDSRSAGANRDQQLASVAQALAAPEMAVDAKAAGVLRLYAADLMRGRADVAQRLSQLKPVSEDERLPPRDPVRVGAELRLASVYAEAGDLEAARLVYDRTGLNDRQCALVDAEPALKGNPGNSADFPGEAFSWGFEGWVITEFDIDADGRTRGLRAVVAYPPFVFDKASTAVYGHARYTQSFRPNGGLGCRASNGTVSFRIPG